MVDLGISVRLRVTCCISFPSIPSIMFQDYSKVPLEYFLIALNFSFCFAQFFLILVFGLINKYFGMPLNTCVCVCVCVCEREREREEGGVHNSINMVS